MYSYIIQFHPISKKNHINNNIINIDSILLKSTQIEKYENQIKEMEINIKTL